MVFSMGWAGKAVRDTTSVSCSKETPDWPNTHAHAPFGANCRESAPAFVMVFFPVSHVQQVWLFLTQCSQLPPAGNTCVCEVATLHRHVLASPMKWLYCLCSPLCSVSRVGVFVWDVFLSSFASDQPLAPQEWSLMKKVCTCIGGILACLC